MRSTGSILRPEQALPAVAEDESAAIFADPLFVEQHVQNRQDGLSECRLYVEGLHCAACVWLLEQSPRMVDGLHSARIQFTRNAIDLIYDSQRCDLRGIADNIRRLGYRPHPWSGAQQQQRAARERRRWTMRFAIAGASMMATMHLAVNLFAGDITGDLDDSGRQFMGWLSWLTCLPAVTWCALPYHRAAWGALRARRATLDVTVSAVLISGFAISTIHLLIGRHDVYFDAMAMFIFFLLAGRLVYIHARDRVMGDAAALHALLPHSARLVSDDDERTVAVSSLRAGNHLRLLSGERIPADGEILSGALDCDCALLTGESLPVSVSAGGSVFAGTQIVSGEAVMSVAQVGESTRMGRLIAALSAAHAGPSPITQLVDRILAWFAPVVAILAAITFVLWWQLDATRAWDQTIALIIVACPCALGLAAPLIQALTVSRAAAQGILIRDAAVSERLAHIRHVVLDKTGTLTTGKMAVGQLEWLHDDPSQISRMVSLAAHSGHPAAQALVQHWPNTERLAVSDVSEQPGRGLSGFCQGQKIRIGKAHWVSEDGHSENAVADKALGHSAVAVAINGNMVLRVQLIDPLRPEAEPFIRFLEQQGMTIAICSGDRAAAVRQVGAALGLPAGRIFADQSPEDKKDLVESLQQSGPVLMLGDGINDAAALAKADIGIGMRGGLEATLPVSSVFLMHSQLNQVQELVAGGKKARQTLRQALAWSVVYNVLGIGAAMIGWWGPWICAIAMPLSSLTIIAIALSGRAFSGQRK